MGDKPLFTSYLCNDFLYVSGGYLVRGSLVQFETICSKFRSECCRLGISFDREKLICS